MCALYTTGYEKSNIDDFIAKLKNNAINTVIDVREIPISRKPGFSKKSLEKRLVDNGIKYVHYRELGSPKDLRDQLHSDGDFDTFFQQYRIYMCSVFDNVVSAMRTAEDELSCLLCYEQNPCECHRSVLADAMLRISDKLDEVVNL